MNTALQLPVTLTSVDCGVCGGVYAILERHRAWCRQNGKAWHCPYCQTGWGFAGNGEVDRLRKELEQERERKAAALSRANEAEKNLASAVRKHSRLQSRVAAGTCPCCQRTFKQLAAHMMRKHPDYSK